MTSSSDTPGAADGPPVTATDVETVFERVDDGVFAVDTDERFTYLNSHAEELLGIAAEDVLGERLWDVFSAAFERHSRRALTRQEQVSFEAYYEPTETWFEARLYPDEGGMSVYFRDVTDRKERERQLEAYETGINAAADIVYRLDADGRYTMVNDTLVERTGFSRDELLGEHVSVTVAEDDVAAIETEIRRALEEGIESPGPVEFELQCADGERVPVEANIAVLREDGEFAGTVGVSRDISERRERQRELRQYEAIVEHMDDVAFIVDEDRRLRYANEASLAESGAGRDRLLGEPILALAERLVVDPDGVDRFEAALDRVMGDGDADTVSVELELDLPGGRTIGDYQLSPLSSDVVDGAVVIARDVTDRRERERELERFEKTINAVDDVVYALDDDGCFELVNDAVADLTGYDRTELLGEHVGVIKDEETVADAENRLRELLDGRAVETTFEFPLQPKDGPEIPAEDHMTIVYDDEGTFTGTAGVIRDITARRERQRKLSGLVETTQELMDAADTDAVAEVTLAAARDVLGFEFSTVRIYDEPAETLVPVASTDLARERMGERPVYAVGESPAGTAFETGESLVYEDLAAVEDDVDRRPVRAAMYVPIGEYGVLAIGSTEPRSFDALDRQVAEVLATSAATACNRAEREAELREERAFIDGLVDSIPDIMYALDDELNYIRWNDRLLEATGYTEAEMAAIDPLDLIAEADLPALEEALDTVFDGERVRAEARIVTRDGDRVPYEFTGAPVTDGTGAVEGVVGIGRDISPRLERERELERQNERLERFASTVSHDLRNPLKMAQSNLDMARREVDSDLLADVAAAHDRMSELIEDLLALARQGQTVDETEPVSVASVAEEAWEHVDTAEATLAVDADERVDADRQRLLQVFENLFRNSVEHAGERVRLRVETTPSGFAVTDDGPGIPEDERDAVFEYGYTTTETGTGLGLAIVTEALNAHGWTVTLGESDEGGVRFDVRT